MSLIRYELRQWADSRTNAGEWNKYYDRLDPKGQAKADERLRQLRDLPPAMWRDPRAKQLSSARDEDCRDIYEIRFKANGIQQRPLGFSGPREGEFTVVLWATHKGKKWLPREKCRIAKERWQAVCSAASKTLEIEID